MNILPDEIIFIIYQYLKPKELCALALVSARYKAIEATQSEVLWKSFLNPTIRSGYKNVFFNTPFARISEQMAFKKDDPDYRFYLTKLEEMISPLKNNRFELIKAKPALLELVKTNCIYAGLVLYHSDPRLIAMINTDLLKKLVFFHTEAIDYILSHPNPEILKCIDYYLLKEMVEKDPQCLKKISKHPKLSIDSDDLAQLTKLGGASGLGGSLSAM